MTNISRKMYDAIIRNDKAETYFCLGFDEAIKMLTEICTLQNTNRTNVLLVFVSGPSITQVNLINLGMHVSLCRCKWCEILFSRHDEV